MAASLGKLASLALKASRNPAISSTLQTPSAVTKVLQNPTLLKALQPTLSPSPVYVPSPPPPPVYVPSPPIQPPVYVTSDNVSSSSSNGGTSASTYLLFIDIVLFLIGIILIVSSQSKCKENPNSDTCKSHKNWGIAITVISSFFLFVILYFKFK